ncbi:hypothetical protein CASFOL_040358 [Castilleja foliolosa]|uniref:Retrotransposon gag domain-containing protein n=1 Tax=Castilleja foliolosa TaxID=1961234 RepID=A0ABD3BFL0_9LAMI
MGDESPKSKTGGGDITTGGGGGNTPLAIETDELSLRIAQILEKQPKHESERFLYQLLPTIDPKLNDSNYSLWARKIKLVLGGRGKWHHVTGVPEPPKPSDSEFPLWEQFDLQILSWIIDSMGSDLVGQFIEFPTSRDLWNGISRTYRSGEDALQIYDLHIRATRLIQGDQTIEKYYQICQSLWNEIDRRDPNNMETPNDMMKYNEKTQAFRLYQFLHGVDVKFDAVKRDLLKDIPLPSIETAYSALRREAARIIIINPPAKNDDVVTGLSTRNQTNRTSSNNKPAKPKTNTQATSAPIDKTKLKCEYCHKVGHQKQGCFELIGYPEWYEKNPKYLAKGVKRGSAAASATATATASDDGDNQSEDLGFAAVVRRGIRGGGSRRETGGGSRWNGGRSGSGQSSGGVRHGERRSDRSKKAKIGPSDSPNNRAATAAGTASHGDRVTQPELAAELRTTAKKGGADQGEQTLGNPILGNLEDGEIGPNLNGPSVGLYDPDDLLLDGLGKLNEDDDMDFLNDPLCDPGPIPDGKSV